MMKKKNKIKEIEKTEYYKTGIMLEEVPVIDRKYYNILHLCLNGTIRFSKLTLNKAQDVRQVLNFCGNL